MSTQLPLGTNPHIIGGLLCPIADSPMMGGPVIGKAISAPDVHPIIQEIKFYQGPDWDELRWPPLPSTKLRPRKTVSPATWRRTHWNELDDEAADLVSSDGVRLYAAEKAMLWRFGYSWKDARETLRRSLVSRYAEEIASRKAFGTEVSATKPAASA